MLDIKFIRENAPAVKEGLAARGFELDLDALLALDERRRSFITETQELQTRRNSLSQEIGKKKKAGEDAGPVMEEVRGIGDRLKRIEEEAKEADERLKEVLLGIPNLPASGVRPGGEEANEVERVVGTIPEFDFEPLPHWDLGTQLGLVDFERGVKLAQARFYVLMGAGAALERVLINYMLSLHTEKHGYTEIFPPFLVNESAMTGTGQFPKFRDEYFTCERDGLSLIPTAEVPLTNLYADEILDADRLPMALTAYTACFRREAGSYGKDTRGVIRVHQFNKIELVRLERPERSDAALEELLGHACAVLEGLGLPYRVLKLAAGDMGASARKTYDLEVWMPGQNRWVEISSCSNFGDYQARRARLRYKEKGGKPDLLHTLNGSGLAVGRTWAAIIENYQQKDGSVLVPKVLRPYIGRETITRQE